MKSPDDACIFTQSAGLHPQSLGKPTSGLDFGIPAEKPGVTLKARAKG
jgi:hypothetical protein